MYSKENRAYYLNRGRCPRCGGKNPVIDGRVLCFECQDKHDREQVERRKAWQEEGRCTRCGRERDSEKVLCATCREYMRDIKHGGAQAAKDRRDWLREAGMCTRCGKTWAEPGRFWCKKCQAEHRRTTKGEEYRKKVNARRQERKEAGLCIDCGAPSNGQLRCQKCNEARMDSTRKYRIIKRLRNGNTV